MYRKHFGLTRHPYDKDLAADDLFPSASLLELNARLKHLVDMRGIGLVTGDSGKACAAPRPSPSFTPASTASSTCRSPPAT